MAQIVARNNFQVKRANSALDLTDPFAPTTMTYHGFSIQVGNRTIGRLTEWTPQQLDREVTPVFELNADTWGQPVDAVPGKASSFTLAFARAEVWNEEIELAFGEDDVYTLLLDQRRPFAIDEVYSKGDLAYRRFRYLGCWFTSKTIDQFTSEGDGIIRVSGEMAFVNRIRTL